MKVIRYPQYQSLWRNSCVTVGNFDGVHIGHQALISTMVKQAKKMNNLAVVVTMQPLPIQLFNGSNAVDLLTDFKLKNCLLKKMGVDVMCVLNFNHQLAAMSAPQFYQQILIEGLKAESVVVGNDFKFGSERSGDFALLQKLSRGSSVQVAAISAVDINSERVSSTAIRQALSQGDFLIAKNMLGRDFNVIGRVAHGKKLGRELGYPTINLELNQRTFPLHGIYVVSITIAGNMHPAVASVGYNPSVGGNAKRIEVHVLDFNQQVYGQSVEVLFYKKLRNEVEFDSLNALTSAIKQDVEETREFFRMNKENWCEPRL